MTNLLELAHKTVAECSTHFNDYSDNARQSRLYLKYLQLWAKEIDYFQEIVVVGELPKNLAIGVHMAYERIISRDKDCKVLYTKAAFAIVDSSSKITSTMEQLWKDTGYIHGVIFWLDDPPSTQFVVRRCFRCHGHKNLVHVEGYYTAFVYCCTLCWQNVRVLEETRT